MTRKHSDIRLQACKTKVMQISSFQEGQYLYMMLDQNVERGLHHVVPELVCEDSGKNVGGLADEVSATDEISAVEVHRSS